MVMKRGSKPAFEDAVASNARIVAYHPHGKNPALFVVHLHIHRRKKPAAYPSVGIHKLRAALAHLGMDMHSTLSLDPPQDSNTSEDGKHPKKDKHPEGSEGSKDGKAAADESEDGKHSKDSKNSEDGKHSKDSKSSEDGKHSKDLKNSGDGKHSKDKHTLDRCLLEGARLVSHSTARRGAHACRVVLPDSTEYVFAGIKHERLVAIPGTQSLTQVMFPRLRSSLHAFLLKPLNCVSLLLIT